LVGEDKMGMNEENENIKFGCDKCKLFKEGTYKELFGGIPNLMLLPHLVCSKCHTTLCLEMTGKFKIISPTRGFELDMAYPQYAAKYGKRDIISIDGWACLQAHVLELKNDKFCIGANAEVKKHWDDILAGIIPFGMRIVKEE